MEHPSTRLGAVALSATLLAACLQVVATAAPAAAATTIHVPADQATINAAIDAAIAGDTIEVSPGTYAEDVSFDDKALVLVAPSGATIDGVVGPVVTLAAGASIEGFVLTGGTTTGGPAIRVVGSGGAIRRNTISLNSANGDLIADDGGTYAFERNVVRGNSCSGSGAAVLAPVAGGSTVTNNQLVDNSCAGIDASEAGFGTVVTNNTLVGNSLAITTNGGEIHNNLVTDNGIGVVFTAVGGGFTNNLVSGNVDDYNISDRTGVDGNVGGDPQFINAATRDLRVSATSPAVDAGTNTTAPAVDFDGTARPLDGADADADAEFDIGAHERDGTEPAAVLPTGSIDTIWTGDGRLDLTNDYHVSMASVTSDRLFTASYRESDSLSKFRVTKYEASGSLSAGFGTSGSGTILRDFTSGGTSFPILLEPAGTGLLAVGEHFTSTTARLGVARLKADGTYDTSFSGDGRALYKVFTSEHDVVTAWRARVLTGGKIGLAVAALDVNGNGDLVVTGQSILRLNANGTADTTFSTDARIPLTLDYIDVAFNPSGSVYAGRKVGSTHEIRKFSAAGPLDKGFSGDGIVPVSCGSHLGAVLGTTSTGRPVLMCVRTTSVGGSPTLNLGIYRYTTSGAPDTSFSGDGKTALVTAGGNPLFDGALEIDDQGKPWAAHRSNNNSKTFIVWTLDAAGNPDASWSGDGKAFVTLPSDAQVADIEKGPSRLYVEDYPSASTNRITALKA